MATGKYHLLGSTRTDGFLDNFDDQAKVVSWITGLTDTADCLGDAITQFVTDRTLFHHTDTTLPLHSVHAVKIGPTKAKAIGYYRRRRWGGTPTGTFANIASFRQTEGKPVLWYRRPTLKSGAPAFNASGQPNGDLLRMNDTWLTVDGGDTTEILAALASGDVKPYYWRPTVYRVRIPTVLTTSPINSVFNLINRVNSDTPTYNGHQFAANTLRFVGHDEDWVDQNGTDTYIVEYEFEARPDGHYRQEITNVPGTGWDIRLVRAYEQAAFTGGAFPSH